jgi:hypothetical protein
MSNLKNLKTNHYKSKLINTKKLKFNNNKYIGFKINDLLEFKFYFKENNLIEFTHKGFSFINIKNIPESTLQYL